MLRKLLTLVAIISGLTAMAAPAHARITALAEAQVEIAGESAGQCRIAKAERLFADKQRALRESEPPRCKVRTIIVYVPTVQLSADRARE